MAAEDGSDFEALLELIRASRGFDFTGYKRTSLARRVRKRLDDLGLPGSSEYLDYLQVHPEEFAVLFDTILINVTAFFRDPSAWDFLRETVLPRIAAAKPGEEIIRVWCAGCASGEEAYTLAMVFAEALGEDAFRRRVKIYATDVDDDALQRARNGSYALKDLDAVPEELRQRYFEVHGPRATFRADLRRSVIFGRHDLVHDAPISRLDLLVTRNTLMYFTADAQSRILARLHYALGDSGFLFLGRAEMLLTHTNLFTPLDLRHRVFTKVPRGPGRERLLVLASSPDREPDSAYDREWRLRDLVVDAGPVAQLTVDADGTLLLANAAARTMFSLAARDLGRRLQDLEVSYRPVELRSRIEEARRERRPVTLPDVDRLVGEGRTQFLEVVLTPMFDEEGAYLGTTIAFVDVTATASLRGELQRNRQELETAYEELQSTNEELETTNEELQSTVEELETTNEELQSANEELETMNEELQSTNSELQAINGEMRQRSVELDRLNAFMESVLTSMRAAVVVVDTEMRVQIWNGRAHEMWGLRADEVVGRSVLALDIGLPVEELTVPLRRTVTAESDGEERIVEAHNRRGRTIVVRITVSPLLEHSARRGAVVLMEEIAEGTN
jgi:two-component system CheB/CheR fusion protein